MPGPYTQESYECPVCHGTFVQPDDWSDARARAQLESIRPGIDLDQTALVCADCCEKILPNRN